MKLYEVETDCGSESILKNKELYLLTIMFELQRCTWLEKNESLLDIVLDNVFGDKFDSNTGECRRGTVSVGDREAISRMGG